jgi:hypothetical protein
VARGGCDGRLDDVKNEKVVFVDQRAVPSLPVVAPRSDDAGAEWTASCIGSSRLSNSFARVATREISSRWYSYLVPGQSRPRVIVLRWGVRPPGLLPKFICCQRMRFEP